MTSQYYLNKIEKESNYPKKCPKCNSSKVAIGSHGFHCLSCDYRHYKSNPKDI